MSLITIDKVNQNVEFMINEIQLLQDLVAIAYDVKEDLDQLRKTQET